VAESRYLQAELVGRQASNKKTIECRREPYEDISVVKLLDGVEIDRLPEWATAPAEPAGMAAGRRPIELAIFLASSSELKEDRDAFELYFLQQNDRLRKLGIYLKIVRWETFLDAMSGTRLQDEYNARVRACDIFVSLFRTKAGQFSGEEFDVAFDQFRKTGKPKVYRYFKEGTVSVSQANRDDFTPLWDFKDKLTGLGHYWTPYESTEHLKRHFRDQLELLLDGQADRPV
jgi:internalin A